MHVGTRAVESEEGQGTFPRLSDSQEQVKPHRADTLDTAIQQWAHGAPHSADAAA